MDDSQAGLTLAARLEPADASVALLDHLHGIGDPANVEGMARFGINPARAVGVSVTTLRSIAKQVLRERKADSTWRHEAAARLWASGVHEAAILAAILDEPSLVSREQALSWASDLDSWDTTDQLCMNLLDKTPFAYELAEEMTARPEEFVKRAGFALIASLAWHDKAAPDDLFLRFLPTIEREASDTRNFVTKAIDWALRHIGKRNGELHPRALATARNLMESDDRAARRVGRVAAKELESEKVLARLGL